MRKILSFMLVLTMMLGLGATGLADAYYLEAAGVTLELPEGMIAEDASDEDAYHLLMAVEGRDDLLYGYSLTYIEELEGVWLEELEEEDLVALMVLIGLEFDDPEFEILEGEDIYYLVVYENDATALHYICLLGGWLTDVWAVTDGTTQLEEEEITLCEYLILSISYDE